MTEVVGVRFREVGKIYTFTPNGETYRRGDGWAHYGEVTDADRNTLKGAITALAEQLAQLRGTLGVD